MLVTHSGRFHADEVFACAMILMIKKIKIVRSRDEDVIAKASLVLDVGGQYCPESGRFDHHQNSFTLTRDNGIPFATAGLIWQEFGAKIFAAKGLKDDYEVQYAINWVDKKLVSDIDAVDNGLYSSDPRPSVSMLVGMMNSSSDDDEVQYSSFLQAVDFCTGILNNFIKSAIAEAEVIIVLEAFAKEAKDGIMILDKNYPYKDFLYTHPEIKRVVYPKSKEGFGVYCNGQANNLPERFRGLRAAELNAVSHLKDTVFCHKSGFMAVCKSLESVLTLAKSN